MCHESAICRELWYIFYVIFMSRESEEKLEKIMPLIWEREVTSVMLGVKANPYVPRGLRLC